MNRTQSELLTSLGFGTWNIDTWADGRKALYHERSNEAWVFTPGQTTHGWVLWGNARFESQWDIGEAYAADTFEEFERMVFEIEAMEYAADMEMF